MSLSTARPCAIHDSAWAASLATGLRAQVANVPAPQARHGPEPVRHSAAGRATAPPRQWCGVPKVGAHCACAHCRSSRYSSQISCATRRAQTVACATDASSACARVRGECGRVAPLTIQGRRSADGDGIRGDGGWEMGTMGEGGGALWSVEASASQCARRAASRSHCNDATTRGALVQSDHRAAAASLRPEGSSQAQSRRRARRIWNPNAVVLGCGSSGPSPGADVAAVRAQSRGRCGSGVGPIPVQMWHAPIGTSSASSSTRSRSRCARSSAVPATATAETRMPGVCRRRRGGERAAPEKWREWFEFRHWIGLGDRDGQRRRLPVCAAASSTPRAVQSKAEVCNSGIEQARGVGDTSRTVERRKDRARDLALDQREEVPLRRPACAADDPRHSNPRCAALRSRWTADASPPHRRVSTTRLAGCSATLSSAVGPAHICCCTAQRSAVTRGQGVRPSTRGRWGRWFR
jgi:hypothetical protein